jgi:hypothetical protein
LLDLGRRPQDERFGCQRAMREVQDGRKSIEVVFDSSVNNRAFANFRTAKEGDDIPEK